MAQTSLPLVTIAIPTYNRASSYLMLALSSALAQSYANLEVLVADNASTDGTADILQGIGDRRLRYIRQPVNIGANRNYNYCLSQARGDYFLLLHDDDAIDEDFVAACMQATRKEIRPGIIRTGVRVIDGRGDTQTEISNLADDTTLGRYYRSWFAGKTRWYLVNTLFHTEQLRAAGGFCSTYHLSEDGFAIARLAPFHPVDVCDVKASFRVHAGERTMADPAAAVLWGREYLELLDCMCGLVDDPEEIVAVRREGRRFFARLAYNRAALLRSRAARIRASYEVLRLFRYRCWPTHRSKTLRFFRQAAAYARRRAERSPGRTVAPASSPSVR
jgi:glycosyltransferase involved in cell wall biosynthesis